MASTRKVGERGQVTIPKEIRDREDISGGDEVEVSETDGKIVIEKKNKKERLKEGYRAMYERDKEIHEKWKHVSKEANRYI